MLATRGGKTNRRESDIQIRGRRGPCKRHRSKASGPARPHSDEGEQSQHATDPMTFAPRRRARYERSRLCASDYLPHLGAIEGDALGNHAANSVHHRPSGVLRLEHEHRKPIVSARPVSDRRLSAYPASERLLTDAEGAAPLDSAGSRET